MSEPSRLQADLARRIRRQLHDRQAAPGTRLVEEDLCRDFHVSRTPIRGALRLLADQGIVAAREGRGFVLAAPVAAPDDEPPDEDADTSRLFNAIAEAGLAPQFSQQEIARRFDASLPIVLRVLHQLADMGLVARRPGHGWSFAGDTASVRNESYAFRRALEPAMLLAPGFRLDRDWAQKARAAHLKLRNKPWRAGDAARFHELNADFHEQLARCSGNRYMLGAVRRQIQLRRFLSPGWDYPMAQVHAAIDDHLEILAALEAGYADKAAALMLHHLTQSATSSTKLA